MILRTAEPLSSSKIISRRKKKHDKIVPNNKSHETSYIHKALIYLSHELHGEYLITTYISFSALTSKREDSTRIDKLIYNRLLLLLLQLARGRTI